jgi:hypothetical protein
MSANTAVALLVAAVLGGVLSHVTARLLVGGHFPRYPRTLHRAWARLGGYFYLPCPGCYRRFGGHEWRPSNVTALSWVIGGHAMCPVCTARLDVLAVLDREGFALTRHAIATYSGLSRYRVRRSLTRLLDRRYVTVTRLAPTGRDHYTITDDGRRALSDATLPRNEYFVMSRARGQRTADV